MKAEKQKRRKKEVVDTVNDQENNKAWLVENANTCISCGAIIPEGMLVCMECEKGKSRTRCIICDAPLENDSSICARCRNMLLNLKSKDQR